MQETLFELRSCNSLFEVNVQRKQESQNTQAISKKKQTKTFTYNIRNVHTYIHMYGMLEAC